MSEEVAFYITEINKENRVLRKEIEKYKKLIEYIKTLELYEYEIDYDYEEEPVEYYNHADMEYHINNWLKVYEMDK